MWFVLGCGYTGTALARELVRRGETVTITKREPAAAAALAAELGPGVRGLALDLRAELAAIDATGAILVCLAPPVGDEMVRVAASGARRIVYVSSTGVYAPGRGGWVDESYLVAPMSQAGKLRVVAEAALAAHATQSWVSLRVAGIHGPGRGLVERIRDGGYRIVGDGTSHVSRIHVDDLVTAIIAAGLREDVTGAVNIADDDPAPIGEVADALAAHLGKPPPPRVAVDSVTPEVATMLTADRKIANGRMKRELGVTLRYPSWRTLLAS